MDFKSLDSTTSADGRVRRLSLKIFADLFSPCKQRIASVDRALNQSLQQADHEFEQAKAGIDRACQDLEIRQRQLLSVVSGHLTKLESLRHKAREHLKAQWVPIPEAPDQPDLGPSPFGKKDQLDFEAVGIELSKNQSRLSALCQESTLSFWPADNSTRVLISITSLVLYFCFKPLAFWWPLLVLGVWYFTGKRLRVIYRELEQCCRELEAPLKQFEHHMGKHTRQQKHQIRQDLPKSEQIRSMATKAAHQEFSDSLKALEAEFEKIAVGLHAEESKIWADCRYPAADWDAAEWSRWVPSESSGFGARIGVISITAQDLAVRLPGLDLEFRLPALIPFEEGSCLLLEPKPEAKDAAAETLQAAVFRILASTPPGKARFTLIDPIGLGHNVAAFMHLGDFNQELISGRAWTEPRHIEQQLVKLTEEMETTIQTYLRKEYASIQDYNYKNSDLAQPLRFLVIFDFPENFSEAAAKRLASIVKNGPRCGIFSLILADRSKKLPSGFNPDELRQFGWPQNTLDEFRLSPDGLPADGLASKIVDLAGRKAADGKRKAIPFERLIKSISRGSFWIGETSEELCVPLGPAGRGNMLDMKLGGSQEVHALLVGRTGSGKTNLMHVIITGLALTYSPLELQLYLIDFKGGVSFKRYADHKLPHAKVIAIESEREFGLSVLQGLEAEIRRRDDAFKAAKVDNLKSYRDKLRSKPRIPRILLVVDEFQELFTENDDVSLQAKGILERLARKGRSYGLHFLLATQSLSGSAQLSAAIMANIRVRIALACSESDSTLILAQDNKAARSLTQAGEGIYNPMGGLIEGNQPFQAVLFDEEQDLQTNLLRVSELSKREGIKAEPTIFEGSNLASLEDRHSLEALFDDHGQGPSTHTDLFLGEPIALLPPVRARIRRQSGSHLMILNRNEEEGIGICVSALLSILTQQSSREHRIHIVNPSAAEGEWAEYWQKLFKIFPPVGNLSLSQQQKQFGPLITTVTEDVQRRQEENGSSKGEIYLFLHGLHRIRALRNGSDEVEDRKLVEQLRKILREGPEVGVHVIAWADTLDNATRGLGRGALNSFGFRVAAVMSPADSEHFLDGAAASKLSRPCRAIFFDEDRPGQLVTFRPYAMPSIRWLNEIASQMRRRTLAVRAAKES